MSTAYVVIPALDEAPNLPRLVRELAACAVSLRGSHELRVVLVDDGSSDGTGELAVELAQAQGLPLTVVRHAQPMGPGRAFSDGFASLAGVVTDEDVVLTLEADNTSRLELVDDMLAQLAAGSDVALASPYMTGGRVENTGWWRVVLSKGANTFVKQGLGIRGLATVSSFYRAYSGAAFGRMQRQFGPGVIERAGFECMVEMVMKMLSLELRITEVPMVLDTSQRIGVSRMRVGRTMRGYLGLFRHRNRWRRAAHAEASTSSAHTYQPA